MVGRLLVDQCLIDPDIGELLAAVTLVIDNGGPFPSFRFETLTTSHPELRHVRTQVKSLVESGSRERDLEPFRNERLALEEATNVWGWVAHAEAYGVDYNAIRTQQAPGPGTARQRSTTAVQAPRNPTLPTPIADHLGLDSGQLLVITRVRGGVRIPSWIECLDCSFEYSAGVCWTSMDGCGTLLVQPCGGKCLRWRVACSQHGSVKSVNLMRYGRGFSRRCRAGCVLHSVQC